MQSCDILQTMHCPVARATSTKWAKLSIFCFFPSLCFLRNEKGFINFKWHYHHHGIKVPSNFSWYYSKAASTLCLSETSVSPYYGDCFYLGVLLFFFLLLKVCTPPSQPSLVFGRFFHGDDTGSLKSDVWNNMSVSNLAWQWEVAFLGAQILWLKFRARTFCWEWINI